MTGWNPSEGLWDNDRFGHTPGHRLGGSGLDAPTGDAKDRRVSPRYEIVGQGLMVHVARRQGRGCQCSTGLVLDVSMYGMGMMCDAPAREGETVFVRVGGEEGSWSAGVVVSFRPTARGPHFWGLHFAKGCPYDLFKAVMRARTEAQAAQAARWWGCGEVSPGSSGRLQ